MTVEMGDSKSSRSMTIRKVGLTWIIGSSPIMTVGGGRDYWVKPDNDGKEGWFNLDSPIKSGNDSREESAGE